MRFWRGAGEDGPAGAADGRAAAESADGAGPASRSGEADFDARSLLDLADDTGGRAEILEGLDNDLGRVDRLQQAVESSAVTLRHRYLVGYEPEVGKRGWRKIRVEVDRPSTKVQARKGYYAEG